MGDIPEPFNGVTVRVGTDLYERDDMLADRGLPDKRWYLEDSFHCYSWPELVKHARALDLHIDIMDLAPVERLL